MALASRRRPHPNDLVIQARQFPADERHGDHPGSVEFIHKAFQGEVVAELAGALGQQLFFVSSALSLRALRLNSIRQESLLLCKLSCAPLLRRF